MSDGAPRVLIVGISARAMAESAAATGREVTTIDAFGDLDTARYARCFATRRDFGVRYRADVVATLARRIDADAVAYAGGWENHPHAVAALAAGRTLLGNSPAVLRRVRDPRRVAQTLRRHALAVPAVRYTAPRSARRAAWLIKPRASGGGADIRSWSPSQAVTSDSYLQERITGVPASIVFAADGERALPLAVTRQLVGDGAFGARAFRYVGNILAGRHAFDTRFSMESDPIEITDSLPDGSKLFARAAALAQIVTEEFGLVGVNGIDFIANDGVPFPIEVNPRYSASMELVERALGISIFDLHVRGCTGLFSAADAIMPATPDGAFGKAVVYARDSVTLGDTTQWLDDASVRDIPHPGERIGRGHPVCTVFARGDDAVSCYAALVRRAEQVYDAIEAAGAGMIVA